MKGWVLVATSLVLAGTMAPWASPAGADAGFCSLSGFQNDAGSGLDAGESATAAVRLQSEGDYWGFLEPANVFGDGDLVDWFAMDLPGTGETVMVEANVNYHGALPVLGVYLEVTAWAPGAEGPTVAGVSTPFAGQNVTFTNTVPGLWHVRVAATELVGPAGPCLVPLSLPRSPSLPTQAEGLYALYFGCNPHCADA